VFCFVYQFATKTISISHRFYKAVSILLHTLNSPNPIAKATMITMITTMITMIYTSSCAKLQISPTPHLIPDWNVLVELPIPNLYVLAKCYMAHCWFQFLFRDYFPCIFFRKKMQSRKKIHRYNRDHNANVCKGNSSMVWFHSFYVRVSTMTAI